jgi:DNA-binding response OmpR family regulator
VISGYTDVAVLDPRLDFLAKPFSIAELVGRVEGLLRDGSGEARGRGFAS